MRRMIAFTAHLFTAINYLFTYLLLLLFRNDIMTVFCKHPKASFRTMVKLTDFRFNY